MSATAALGTLLSGWRLSLTTAEEETVRVAAQNLSRSGMTQLASAALQWLEGPRRKAPPNLGPTTGTNSRAIVPYKAPAAGKVGTPRPDQCTIHPFGSHSNANDESQYQMVVGIDKPSDDDIPDLLSDGYHSDSDSEDSMPPLMSCGSGIEVDSKGPARAGVSNDGSSHADSDDVPDLISSDTDSEDEEVAARCRRQLRQACVLPGHSFSGYHTRASTWLIT